VATLQTYLTATQRLLHDANFKYWTQQTLIDAINQPTAQRSAQKYKGSVLASVYKLPADGAKSAKTLQRCRICKSRVDHPLVLVPSQKCNFCATAVA
jgi:hypothetical protein